MRAYSIIPIVSLVLILVFGTVMWTQGYIGEPTDADPQFKESINFGVQITSVVTFSVSDLTSVTGGVLKGSGWNVIVSFRNIGSTDATINNVYINEKRIDVNGNVAMDDGNGYMKSEFSIPVRSGTSRSISISIEEGEDSSSNLVFTSGLTLNVKLHSAAGADYLAMTRLD